MTNLAVLLALALLGIVALLPAYWAWNFVIYYYRHTGVTPPVTEPVPNVAVILCLRGADPSLEACLTGLLHQDYPRYQIQIVVDHQEDPACAKVHEILARGYPDTVQVHVEALEKPCPSCSLKVCSQLQVIGRLERDVDVVALIDADSIPAPDWLRAMVGPMSDATVGATSGLRWYAPLDGGWGSVLRYSYNCGSFAQMYAFEHPWGGSLAIRAEVFRRTTLKHRWGHALCEDSALLGPLRELGQRLVFVPAATQINCESIDFDASLRFIQRQILCVRLDHVAWPRLLALNLLNSFALFAIFSFVLAGLYWEQGDWIALGCGILGLYAVATSTALQAAERVIRRNFHVRGQPSPPQAWRWKMIPALFLTQCISMRLLVRAQFLREVAWRGILYRIFGPGHILLQKYQPYRPSEQAGSSQHSVT